MKSEMIKFHFTVVLWGDSYADLFLKVVLPNHLSNLLSLNSKKESVYKIYTTSKDAERIRKSHVFLRLSEIMPTEIIFIDNIHEMYFLDIDSAYRFKALSECYRQAINSAVDDGAAFVFLSPDAIWSDGTFTNLEKIAKSGKRAVMVIGGIRVVKETFMPAILKHFYSENELIISVSSREMVKLALEHLHPYAQTFFWESSKFHPGPSWLFWHVEDEGILARGYHLTPLMTYPQRQITTLSGEIDGGNFVSFAHPNFDDLYIVEDSDEIMPIEISDSKRFDELQHNKASIFKAAEWVRYHTNYYHRKFVRHRIRVHFNDISPHWKEVEKFSDKVVNSIGFILKLGEIFTLLRFFTPKYIIKGIRDCLTSPLDLMLKLMLILAITLLRNRMFSKGVFWVNKYLDYCGEKHCNLEVVYNFALQLKEENHYKYAEQIFKKLIGKNFNRWEVYFQLGEISYWVNKDKAKAREYFEKTLEISPEHINAQKYLETIDKNKSQIVPYVKEGIFKQ